MLIDEPLVEKPFKCSVCKNMKEDLGARFRTEDKNGVCVETVFWCLSCKEERSHIFKLMERGMAVVA